MIRLGASCALFLVLLGASAPARADATPAPSPEATEARADIERTLASMRARAGVVRDLLRDARRRGTPPQIRCVDEALSRADVAVRHAREHADAAVTAYAKGDVEAGRASHRLVIEQHMAEVLAARDASACAPPRAVRIASGTTTVRVQIDPRIPRVQ